MKNMSFWEEDMFLSDLDKLDPFYRGKVIEGEMSLKEAFSCQQADEHYAEEEWIEQMEKEYSGVIYAPKAKISTICETDDIPF